MIKTFMLILFVSLFFIGCSNNNFVKCEYPKLKTYYIDSNISVHLKGYDKSNVIVSKNEMKDLIKKFTDLKNANSKSNEQIEIYTEVINGKERNK